MEPTLEERKMHWMTPALWRQINHFTSDEAWGDPMQMDRRLIFELDDFRDYLGRKHPIIVHCGYEIRPGRFGGQHPIGTAVDIHIKQMSLLDQFIKALRFGFVGIGVYPIWNNPGLHLDMRINVPHRQLWGCVGPRKYVPINRGFLCNIMKMCE